MSAPFPERLLTEEEIKRARELIDAGYRHEVEVRGSEGFVRAIKRALELIRTAGEGYWDLLRAYIRAIVEVEGFSQLRPEEATVWVSTGTAKNPVLTASLLVQKALQMKRYLEGKPFYGHLCEIETTRAKYDFIRELREKCDDEEVRRLCDEALNELEASLYDLVP